MAAVRVWPPSALGRLGRLDLERSTAALIEESSDDMLAVAAMEPQDAEEARAVCGRVGGRWRCASCTLVNAREAPVCAACGASPPLPVPTGLQHP